MWLNQTVKCWKIFKCYSIVTDEAPVIFKDESEFKRSGLQWRAENTSSGDRSDRSPANVFSVNVLRVRPQATMLRYAEGAGEECGLSKKNGELPDGWRHAAVTADRKRTGVDSRDSKPN